MSHLPLFHNWGLQERMVMGVDERVMGGAPPFLYCNIVGQLRRQMPMSTSSAKRKADFVGKGLKRAKPIYSHTVLISFHQYFPVRITYFL